MSLKRTNLMLITLGLLLTLGGSAAAQDTTSPAATADTAKQQEEKAKPHRYLVERRS